MKSCKIGFQILFLLVISTGMLTGGCVHKSSVFSESAGKYFSLNNEDIQAAISRLEEISKNDPQSAVDSRLLLSLCLLYSSPNNKQPDYRRAKEMLETYLRSHTDAAEAKDLPYLSSLLMQINQLQNRQDALTAQYDRLKKDVKSLEGNTAALKEKNGHLLSQNKSLKDIIEQLRLLDIRLEERRNTL